MANMARLHLLTMTRLWGIDSWQEGIVINPAFKMSISSFMSVKIVKIGD